MYLQLFRHRWTKTFRSTFFRQGWGVKILLGLAAIYFLALFGSLGIFMKEILEKSFEEADKLTPIFTGGILLYLLADLAMRFFLQDLNVISVQHYLSLPISKKKIIHFLLQGSVFNFFNLIPLFFIIPWAIRVIPAEYGTMHTIIWPIAALGVVLSNHFLAIYLKRVLAVKAQIFWIIVLLLGGLYALHFWGLIDLTEISKLLFLPMAQSHFLAWWPLVLAFVVYQVNYRFLLGMTHLDRWQTKAKDASTLRFSFLENRGPLGMMIANELKLITRNRRTKTVVYMCFFFAFYGLIFYTQEIYAEGYAWLLFVGIFTTGIFMINYGQFLVSWESSYFDGILTRAYEMETYYRSKYYLLVVSSIFMFIITLPVVYFGITYLGPENISANELIVKVLWINTATFFYNMGINSAVLLFASTYNKKPIDLSKGSAFNYQGTGAAQWVIVIPLMVVPMLLFQAFNVFGAPDLGLGVLAGMGLIGLALHKLFIKQTIKNFKEKKYINAAGYRQHD